MIAIAIIVLLIYIPGRTLKAIKSMGKESEFDFSIISSLSSGEDPFISSVLKEKGPPRLENDKNMDLSCRHLRVISPDIFANLTELIWLNLSDNELISLREDVFKPLSKLKGLILKNNRLTSLEAVTQPLHGVSSLEVLDLGRNNFSNGVGINDFEYLTNSTLKKLVLNECEIGTMHQKAFLPLRKLEILDLSKNRLNFKSLSLGLMGLNDSSSLRTLIIGNNELFSSADDGRCPGNKDTLRKYSPFSPVYNYLPELTKIDSTIFPHLAFIDAQNADVAFVETGLLQTAPKLKGLNLSRNKLTSIPSFRGSSNFIEHMDLSFNPISDPFTKGKNLYNLRKLNLTSCQIQRISKSHLKELQSLEELYLVDANIKAIEPFAFSELLKLQILDLSFNNIEELVNNTFANLLSLKVLRINNNNLKIFPYNDPFAGLHSLRTLEFAHNSLCEMWEWLARDLGQLILMDMSYNKIVAWRWRAFPPENSLRTLLLQNNVITFLTQEMLEDFKGITHVNLTDNSFNCSACELSLTMDYVKLNASDKDRDKFTCMYPAGLRNEKLLNVSLPLYCTQASVSYKVWLPLLGSLLLVFCAYLLLAYRFRWSLRYRWSLLRSKFRRRAKESDGSGGAHKYGAFVSYSDKDSSWIKHSLLPNLEGGTTRWNLCLHERDFQAGKNITDNIFECIENSHVFFAVLSENFLASQWCNWELNMALTKDAARNRDDLVVILLHDLPKNKISRQVHYLMKKKTYLKWPESPDGQALFWSKLKSILQCKIGTSPTTRF